MTNNPLKPVNAVVLGIDPAFSGVEGVAVWVQGELRNCGFIKCGRSNKVRQSAARERRTWVEAAVSYAKGLGVPLVVAVEVFPGKGWKNNDTAQKLQRGIGRWTQLVEESVKDIKVIFREYEPNVWHERILGSRRISRDSAQEWSIRRVQESGRDCEDHNIAAAVCIAECAVRDPNIDIERCA